MNGHKNARLTLETLESRLAPVANLGVGPVITSALVVPGQTIAVSYSVSNVGDAATSRSSWNDVVVLSADNRFDATDIVLADLTRVGQLAARTSYTRAVNVTIPTTTSMGLKNLLVVTDSRNLVVDASRTNNTRALPLGVLNPESLGFVDATQGVLGAPLVLTSVDVSGTPTARFQSSPSRIYSVAGFRLTNIDMTVTAEASPQVNGTATLLIPTGTTTLSLPVQFSVANGKLSISGGNTFFNFRYGMGAGVLTAAVARIDAAFEVNLSTRTTTGEVTLNASRATLIPQGTTTTGPVTAHTLQATLTPAGKLTGSAALVRINVPKTLTIEAANVSVSYDPTRPTAALAILTNATATADRFPGAVASIPVMSITPSGFSIPALDIIAPEVTLDSLATATNLRMAVRGLVYNRSTGLTATTLSATASLVNLRQGQATAEGVTFVMSPSTGTMTTTFTKLTATLGSASITATTGRLAVGTDATGALASVASAKIQLPNTPLLTITGFRLERDGQFGFDAMTGLVLPNLGAPGPRVTSSFRGQITRTEDKTLVNLTGTGTLFGTAIKIEGMLEASSAGLLGALRLSMPNGLALSAVGTILGLSATGEAHFLINKTAEARQITIAGLTRNVAANGGQMVLAGSVAIRGFKMEGTFDFVPQIVGTVVNLRISGDAHLELGRFGTFDLTPTGSFTITQAGIIGSMVIIRRAETVEFVRFEGETTYRVDTVSATKTAFVRIAGGIRPNGLPAIFQTSAAVNIGFRDNPGTVPDAYFISIPTTSPLQATLFGQTVRFSGELRSDGFARLTGSLALSVGIPNVMSASTNLTMTITRSTTEIVTLSGSGTATGRVGPFAATGTASLSASGLLRVTLLGQTFEFWLA
jgi:hypothetical protein